MVLASNETLHPLIYKLPITRKEVVGFPFGMTSTIVDDCGTENEQFTPPETQRIDEGIVLQNYPDARDVTGFGHLAVWRAASPVSQILQAEDHGPVLRGTTANGDVTSK